MQANRAREIAEKQLRSGQQKLVITKEEQVEFGTLFYFNTIKYLESKNPFDAVCGAGPLFVHRDLERVIMLSSARSAEEQINDLNTRFRKESGVSEDKRQAEK